MREKDMSKTKHKKEPGGDYSKFGQTLRPYENRFQNPDDDVSHEVDEERKAVKNYQEEIIYKFRREFSGIGEKFSRHGLTLAMRRRLLTFARESEANRLAVDVFYMNYYSAQSPEYKNAKKNIFDVLDRMYAEKWEHTDAFVHALIEALERNPQAQSMFACAASSRELQNVKAEGQAALAHASVAGFLDKTEKDRDLASGLKSEMSWQSELRDACQPYVEDIANDLVSACNAPVGSDEREKIMKNIFTAIGDQYDSDMDLGHVFAECLIEKICELQQATGTSYLTQRQNLVVADIAGRVYEWEKEKSDMFRPDI